MTVDNMDLVTLIVEALKFIFPAYCANAAPVLGGGGRLIDSGKKFFDGKPIFGRNKTFRGFFFGFFVGLCIGLVEVFLFNYPWLFCIMTPLGALLGDLTGAFIKRRLDLSPGALLPVVDQLDFVIGALLFSIPISIVNWDLAIVTIIITPPVHLFTNFLAYKLGLKKNPW